MNIVGVTLSCDWERAGGPFRDPRRPRFFRRIGRLMGDTSFVVVDWCTVDADGRARIFDLEKELDYWVALPQVLDFLHFFQVGYGSSRRLSLAQKWSELEDKLRLLERAGVRCVNSVPALIYGLSKRYLFDLESAALPIVATKAVPSSLSLAELRSACGDVYRVVKPINGECGRLVRRLESVDESTLEEYARGTKTLLLQPFVEEIYAGEHSLVFLAERFSHGVKKIPQGGEFRANGPFRGAILQAYAPTRREIELGFQVRERFRHALDTYRLDLVATSDGPRILEVETVDPGHYCALDGAHAERLAQFYAELLTARRLSPATEGAG